MICKNRFANKVAVVTGGYQGIGAAIAKRFVSEGGKTYICGRSQEKLDLFLEKIGREKADGCVCDISDEEQVKAMVASAAARFGKIDCLFNNAGIIKRNDFLNMPISDLDESFSINVRGTALVSQCVARLMVEQNIQGAIVCTASTNSLVASPGLPAYGTTKAAVNLLTKCMALDLSEYGIRVNCFGPATTITPMTAATCADPERIAMFTKGLDIKRFAEPEEMASVALFLASDDASYMTGAFVPVDGGTTSRL